MRTWTRICCAVDFSPESRLALEQAAELAWRFAGVLTVLHVDDRPHLSSESALAPSTQGERDSTLELERQLGDWAGIARTIASRPVSSALLSGSPAEAVAEYARLHAVDVLVLGTHARTAVEDAVLGSVAATVVRLAPCSVVVVRPPAVAPAVRERGAAFATA